MILVLLKAFIHFLKIGKLVLSLSLSLSAKFGLSPSKKNCVIFLIGSPLRMMKTVFYFILKALFIFKIFKFLSRLSGHAGRTA